jgi:TonB family protein
MRSAAFVVVAVLAAAPVARAQTNEGLQIPRPPDAQQIEAGKLSKVPKQTKFVQADYPKEAAAKGIEAEVVLLLDINAQGKVDGAAVAQPATPAGMGFDEAAVLAAQQFEFEPAELDGKPIAVQLTYRYKFKLTPKTEAAPAAPAAPGATAPAVPAAPARQPVVNFSGVLRERGTRLPLPGVMVTVFREDGVAPPGGAADVPAKPVGYEATSDASGRFRFFDLAPGDWKVLIEPPGFYPFRTTETIRAGEGVETTYYVERGSYNPYDVTVTATRPRKEVSRTVLSAQEIEKIPGAAGDPLAVVQNFAGVARTPVAGQIVVRGSAPEDTRIFVDGVEVPLIYHFGGLRSVIPVGMLDAIEFYPGNFAPGYGRATGGIIDVQVKKLQPKKVGGYADVSLLDTGVFLEVPLGDKAAVAVAGRRSYIDYIIQAVVPDDSGVGLVTAPRYYDGQLLATFRPAPAHDLRAFFFGADDRLELLFQNPASVTPDVNGSGLSISTSFYRSLFTYRYVPGDKVENTLRVSQGRDWLNFNFGSLTFDVDIYSAQVRDTVRHRFGEQWALSYGVDFLYGKSDFLVRAPRPPKEGEPPNNAFDLTRTVESRGQGQSYLAPAGFIEGELQPLPSLLLLPGLRVDYFSRVEQTLVQPRLTARWQFADHFTVKGGAGLFVQPPDFDETDDIFGNPQLELERALHYSGGVEFKPLAHLTFDITGFYKDLHRLVSKTDAIVPTPDGKMRPLIYDSTGTGEVVGMEVVGRHELSGNFTGWLAYTLSRAVRRDSGAAEDRLFDFDQTHILTAVGSYLLPRNWQVGARFRLVSGNPRTPIVRSIYNATLDRYEPVYGSVNSERNTAFHQLDLRVDKRWIYQGWMLNLYLDVQNVYNHLNTEGVNYNFDFRLATPQTGLPILTILGIRADF